MTKPTCATCPYWQDETLCTKRSPTCDPSRDDCEGRFPVMPATGGCGDHPGFKVWLADQQPEPETNGSGQRPPCGFAKPERPINRHDSLAKIFDDMNAEFDRRQALLAEAAVGDARITRIIAEQTDNLRAVTGANQDLAAEIDRLKLEVVHWKAMVARRNQSIADLADRYDALITECNERVLERDKARAGYDALQAALDKANETASILKEANLDLTLQVNELHAEVSGLLDGKNKAVLDLGELACACLGFTGDTDVYHRLESRPVLVADLRALRRIAKRVWPDADARKCDGPVCDGPD